ncbi:DUF4393 domain-containing protein [Cryobacterium sp. TmT2-59]|nr:DUF4393 domain-containing protein [Cryobacterium sp. TmT2-59]
MSKCRDRNLLLPLAAINFGIDKAKSYFETRFGDELDAKLAGVPSEYIVEPKASVAGPAIQGLAYSFAEDDLRVLYLNLLRTSMDGRNPDAAHPAFVEIIKQLTATEARLLSQLGRGNLMSESFGVVQLRSKMGEAEGGGYTTIARHLMDVDSVMADEEISIEELTRAVENWVRLGLFTVDYGTFFADKDAYAWESTVPNLDLLRKKLEGRNRTLALDHGLLTPTLLGKDFYKAAVG